VSPDSISPVLLVIHGLAKSVVDAGEDCQEPCDDSHDSVRPNGLNAVGVASCERVCFEYISNNAWGSIWLHTVRQRHFGNGSRIGVTEKKLGTSLTYWWKIGDLAVEDLDGYSRLASEQLFRNACWDFCV
jgi:hypothetical protein